MLVSQETPSQPSQLIILGRGIEMAEGEIMLGQGSQERADRAAGYYYGHRGVFNEEDARIVCSGGFPRLSDEDFGDLSEGKMMADVLVRSGVPHKLIEVEGESRSTLQNFLYSEPLLNLGALSIERPLGIVTHGAINKDNKPAGHIARGIDLVGKVYGSETPCAGILAPGEDDPRRQQQERVMRFAWRAVLAGIAERNTARLVAREEQITRVATFLRKPLSLIIK